MFYRQKSRAFLAPHCILGLGSTYGDAVPRLHAKEDTAQALMPCAMSSLRGASGVVGCDRVVCPLVLHATTIAHLDVLLCTLLFFLLCAVLLCGAVPLSCGVPCALPALFSWGNTCPIYGGAICGSCTLPIYVPYFFRLAIYDPFCTYSKSRPLDSECGFPKVGLNFRCSVFLFAEFSPVKFPA